MLAAALECCAPSLLKYLLQMELKGSHEQRVINWLCLQQKCSREGSVQSLAVSLEVHCLSTLLSLRIWLLAITPAISV